MRILAAAGVFLLAIILGFGIGSYRSAAVAEFMAVSVTCEIVKVAGSKGYATDRGKLVDAIAASPKADGLLKSAIQSVRRSKQC
ncbi:MAG: hypothetical protein ABL904_14050 [Hyphomicrobiaceae bacterium]